MLTDEEIDETRKAAAGKALTMLTMFVERHPDAFFAMNHANAIQRIYRDCLDAICAQAKLANQPAALSESGATDSHGGTQDESSLKPPAVASDLPGEPTRYILRDAHGYDGGQILDEYRGNDPAKGLVAWTDYTALRNRLAGGAEMPEEPEAIRRFRIIPAVLATQDFPTLAAVWIPYIDALRAVALRLAQSRAEVIEECARVCDAEVAKQCDVDAAYRIVRSVIGIGKDCAAAIRALSPPVTPERGHLGSTVDGGKYLEREPTEEMCCAATDRFYEPGASMRDVLMAAWDAAPSPSPGADGLMACPWKPMSEYPRDHDAGPDTYWGPEVLVLCSNNVCYVAKLEADEWIGRSHEEDIVWSGLQFRPPIAWMPLPPPPRRTPAPTRGEG